MERLASQAGVRLPPGQYGRKDAHGQGHRQRRDDQPWLSEQIAPIENRKKTGPKRLRPAKLDSPPDIVNELLRGRRQ
jgi:hypothetical protein